MTKQTVLHKILQYPLTKIVIGLVLIAGLVFFTEWSGRKLSTYLSLPEGLKNIIISIADSVISLAGYVILYRFYEKRRITELSFSDLGKNAVTGFSIGLILQSLFILVIYVTGNYLITGVNPVSFVIPALTTSLTAGFVSEIMIRGIVFRLIEKEFGTINSLILFIIIFAFFHINVEGANFLSVLATAMQAGFLLSAAYVFTRSLWFTIFLHFAWDFAEPGIFGAINPGNLIGQSLISCQISGPRILTGGQLGPQNSIQALILCTFIGILFVWLAKNKGNLIKPYWKS